MWYDYEILYYTNYTGADTLYIESQDEHMPNIVNEALEKLGYFDGYVVTIVRITKTKIEEENE